MTELPSNDYISQINKNGSGINIPQIVGAIVDAEIDPVKNPVVARQEKVETAISGLAQLKNASELTKTNINNLKTASYYATTSSDAAQIAATVTNQGAVSQGQVKITNVSKLAQAMSFSVPAPGSTTTHYTTANAQIGSTYSLTIKVGGAYTNNPPGHDDVFTDAGDVVSTGLSLAATEGISSVAQKLDAIAGLSAKVVMVGPAQYKIAITGETGASNAFQIRTAFATGNGANRAFDVWDNAASGSAILRTFDQTAQDLLFKADGLAVARESNTVTDLIPGVSFEVKAAGGTGAEIKTSLSKENIQATVKGFVDELNAYKSDLRALSLTDRSGAGEHGDLFGDEYVKSRIRALANFMITPINGYGSVDPNKSGGVFSGLPDGDPTYLAQLGFKTETNGTITFDQRSFDSTFLAAPERFSALTEDRATISDPDFSVIWSHNSPMPPGVYALTQETTYGRDSILSDGSGDDRSIYFHDDASSAHGHHFLRRAPEGGVYKYTKNDTTGSERPGTTYGDLFPGFQLRTTNASVPNAHSMTLTLGKSFTTLFSEFHDDILNNTYEHRRQVENYADKAAALQERLAVIEARSVSLAQAYSKNFEAMESSVTGFNSTGNMLSSYVTQWNNR